MRASSSLRAVGVAAAEADEAPNAAAAAAAADMAKADDDDDEEEDDDDEEEDEADLWRFESGCPSAPTTSAYSPTPS